MRITNNMMMWNLMNNVNRNMSALAKFDHQLATGKKFQLPSDDPVGVSKSLKYHTDISKVEQYKKNLDDGQSWLDATEEAVKQVNGIIKRTHELTIQGKNDTNSPEDLKKISAEIKQLKEQLISTANSSFAGKYIFSGYKTDTKLLDNNGYYKLTNYAIGVEGSFDKNILRQNELSQFNVGELDRIAVNTVGASIFGIFDGDLNVGNYKGEPKGYEVNNNSKLANNRSSDKAYMVQVYDELILTLDTASQYVDRLSGITGFEATGANPQEYKVHTVNVNTGGVEPDYSIYDPNLARTDEITAISGAKLYISADEKLKGTGGNGIQVNILSTGGPSDPTVSYNAGTKNLDIDLHGSTVSSEELAKLIEDYDGGGYFKAFGDNQDFAPADAAADVAKLKDAYDANTLKLANGVMSSTAAGGGVVTIAAKAGGRFEGIDGNEVNIKIINSGYSPNIQANLEEDTYPPLITIDLGNADRTAADIKAALENINSGKDFAVTIDTPGAFTLADDAANETNTTLKGGINQNSLIGFEAVDKGIDGNNYNVVYSKQGAKEPLKVEVTGNTVQVFLATDANGKSISTGNDVVEAIKNSYSASKIIRAFNIEGSTGEGVLDTTNNMVVDSTLNNMPLNYGKNFEANASQVPAKVQIGQIYQQNKENGEGLIKGMSIANADTQENNAFMYFEVSEIDKAAGTVKVVFKSNQYGKDGNLTSFPDEEITLNANGNANTFSVGDIEFDSFTLGNIEEFSRGDKVTLNVRAAELHNKDAVVIENGTDDVKSIVVDHEAFNMVKDDPIKNGKHEIKAFYIKADTGDINEQSFNIEIETLTQGVSLKVDAKNGTDIKGISGDHIPADRSYRITEKEDYSAPTTAKINLEKSYNKHGLDMVSNFTIANVGPTNEVNANAMFEIVGKDGDNITVKVKSNNIKTDGTSYENEEYFTLTAGANNTVTLNTNKPGDEYNVTFDLTDKEKLSVGDKFTVNTTAEVTNANQDALVFDTYHRDSVTLEDDVKTKVSRTIVLNDNIPLDGIQLGAIELNDVSGKSDMPKIILEAKGSINDGGITKFSSTASQKPVDQIDETIGRLQDLLENLLSVQADIGAKGNRLELIDNRLTAENLNFTTLLAKNENIDYSKTILDFKEMENVYNASLSVGAKIIQPSLLDFLR